MCEIKFLMAACIDKDQVLERAHSRVGEAGYNVVWKNCEHFAARILAYVSNILVSAV